MDICVGDGDRFVLIVWSSLRLLSWQLNGELYLHMGRFFDGPILILTAWGDSPSLRFCFLIFVILSHFLVHIATLFPVFCIFNIDQISSIYYRQCNVILIMSSACWESMLPFEIIQKTFFPFNLQPSIISLWPEASKVLPFPLHYLHLNGFDPPHLLLI